MIWEFYKHEKHHGVQARAYEIVFNGANRGWRFCNDPKHQRIAHCKECGIKIPRSVPRLKFVGSWYYGSGYYCMTCGLKKVKEKRKIFYYALGRIQKEIKILDDLEKISNDVIGDEWYPKKMALGKMFQVMEENQKNSK